MAYTRINWENEPSVNTPINEDNLNHMEDGIVQNETDIAGKMDANNPTGTGSLQVGTGNMKTDGNPSYALGYNAYAEGDNSFAFGSSTRAKKQGAYAMGSHAEAREYFSMALGEEVIAASIHQTVRGKYNEIDADGVYLDIVGGGNPLERKNVETLTPNGDKWVAGDYTNGNGETLHGIYEALPVDAESGNPAVITDAFGGACKSLKLTLEPIQSGSGTPSPQNVRPISGRTQSAVTRTGKNVFDKNATDKTQNSFLDSATGNETFSPNWSISGYIKTEGDISYVLSGMNNLSTSNFSLVFYDKNKTFIRGVASQNMTFTIPSGEGIEYIRFDYKNADENTIQLEVGSMATTYEPYTGESITISFGQTVYGGTLDVLSGEMVIDRAAIDLGAKDWNSASNVGRANSVTAISGAVNPSKNADKADMICNKYKVLPYYVDGQPGHDANSTLNSMAIFASNGGTVFVYDSNLSNMTGAQVKTALSGTIVCYKLASPITVQLTPEQISLLHGDNVLTTDADNIEASYSADIALYIDKKIAEGSQNNRSLSKGGSGDEESKEEEKEEEKKEEIETKEEEPLTKEVR